MDGHRTRGVATGLCYRAPSALQIGIVHIAVVTDQMSLKDILSVVLFLTFLIACFRLHSRPARDD